jgi:hypothetical protein
MKRHKHAKLLETIVHHILLSKDTIHLYKVKSHAGISEMSALMSYQNALRKIKVAMKSTLTPTPTPIHPYFGQQGWKTLPHQFRFTYQIL